MAKKLKENRGSVKLLRVGLLWLFLAALIAVLSVVAINIGSVSFSVSEIITSITSKDGRLQ